jgi:hypothetical protein
MTAFDNTDGEVHVYMDIFTLTEGFLVEKPRYQPKGNTHQLFRHRKLFQGSPFVQIPLPPLSLR